MRRFNTGRVLASVIAIVAVTALLAAPAAGASAVRAKGSGWQFSVSWVELDPEDVLGLPGNVHLGWLGAWSDQWGTYSFGHVADLDCPNGQLPYGGHHEAVVAEAAQVTEAAVEDAIVMLADSGATTIDSAFVIETVEKELADELPEEIEDEVPFCEYVQDRFLDGAEAVVTVDMTNRVATMTGVLTVHGGHGEHGEPGDILGRPPVNLTITGGEWSTSEWSYSYKSESYKYSDWRRGTDYYGGAVSGAIGAMGFDDDPDDEAYGGFGTFDFKSVERIR